jgi:DNA-binding transcriptional MerR regulator
MPAARARPRKSASAFRSIGEVADALGVEAHVLRYWESKFPDEVQPVKRSDGRRLFRPEDIEALRAIRILVHERGLTLKGAKALLETDGVEAVLGVPAASASAGEPVAAASPARALQESVARAFDAPPAAISPARRARLETVLAGLEDMKARLDAARLRPAA